MQTVLVEIEAVINSRPLPYISEDAEEEGPLTPSQLLIGRRVTTLPFTPRQDLDHTSDRKGLLRREKHRLGLVKNWWSRWHSEYLHGLLRHTDTWKSKNRIRIGDVVLIHDDNARRQMWKSGIVLETVPGRDGCVRLVKLKTEKDIITRPIQRLYPTELTISEDIPEEAPKADPMDTPQPTTVDIRPELSDDSLQINAEDNSSAVDSAEHLAESTGGKCWK